MVISIKWYFFNPSKVLGFKAWGWWPIFISTKRNYDKETTMKPLNLLHVWVVETWVEVFMADFTPFPHVYWCKCDFRSSSIQANASKTVLQMVLWFLFGHVTLICGKIFQVDLHIFVKWVGSAATPSTIVTIVGSTTRSGPRLLETPASQAVWTTHSEKTTCWAEGRGIAGMADGWWGVEIRAYILGCAGFWWRVDLWQISEKISRYCFFWYRKLRSKVLWIRFIKFSSPDFTSL